MKYKKLEGLLLRCHRERVKKKRKSTPEPGKWLPASAMSTDLPKGSMNLPKGEEPNAMLRAAWLPAMGQLGPPHKGPLFWERCLVACSASSSFLSWIAMALLASGLGTARLGMSIASLRATAACHNQATSDSLLEKHTPARAK